MANITETLDPNSSQTFFNGYFSQPVQVDQAVYGQVLTFFQNRSGSYLVAESLAQALVTLCYNNSLDPLVMLTEFDKATNDSQLKQLLLSFFNATKGATSKLGYSNIRQQNKYVSRTILA